MIPIALGLLAVAALCDWGAVASDERRVEDWAKPAVLVLMIALTLLLPLGPTATSATRAWVVLALTLSLVGDVLLLPRLDQFVFGLGAFLVGHLAYAPALAPLAASGLTIVIVAVVLLVPALVLGRRIASAAAAQHGDELGRAVTVYIGAVGLTAVLAVATLEPTVALGGLAFMVSDTVLGWDRFVEPIPQGRAITHVTYHFGQFGLLSVVLV